MTPPFDSRYFQEQATLCHEIQLLLFVDLQFSILLEVLRQHLSSIIITRDDATYQKFIGFNPVTTRNDAGKEAISVLR